MRQLSGQSVARMNHCNAKTIKFHLKFGLPICVDKLHNVYKINVTVTHAYNARTYICTLVCICYA